MDDTKKTTTGNVTPTSTTTGGSATGNTNNRFRSDRRSNSGPRNRGRSPFDQAEKLFDERVLHIDRVARVVKGGRRFRFRALVVVGDAKNNKVGIGSAKGADVTSAVSKATDIAKKNLIKIELNKGTLFHDSQAKVGGANILIMPASSGTGLIAGGVVRIILEVAGVTDALSKSIGSTNKTNISYATIKALEQVVPSSKWVTTKEVNAAEKAKKTKAATKGVK